jgi:hypothetical protein
MVARARGGRQTTKKNEGEKEKPRRRLLRLKKARKEDDMDIARHVTNPRFGMAHTRSTDDVIKPVDYLRQSLVASYRAKEGEARYKRYQNSIRNAALTVAHAIRNRWWGKNVGWGFLFLAMDVAADTDQNAWVLDLNSGPSFYHKEQWPNWFVQERSAMIRAAADIIQEVAFRKLVMQQRRFQATRASVRGEITQESNLTAREDVLRQPLEELGGWDMLYGEDHNLSPLPPEEGILPRGKCVTLHRGAPPL